MTIRSRMLLVCVVPLCALAVSLVASYAGTRIASRSVHQVTTVNAPLADLAREMQRDVMHIQDAFTDLSATRKKDEMNESFAEAEKHRQSLIQGIARLREQAGTDSSQLQRLGAISTALDTYMKVGQDMATAYVTKGSDAGNAIMGNFDQAADQLAAALEPIVQEQIDGLHSGLLASSSQQERLSSWVLISGIALILLSAAIAIRTIRKTTSVLMLSLIHI